jgi:cytochrome c553
MMRSLLGVAALALAATSLPALAAGDAEAGKKKAAQCQTCHGMDGQSKLPEAPNLAGQTAYYLNKSLTDFKGGVRKNEMMSVVIEALTPADIADLAAYYSAIKVTVAPPK